MNDYMPELSTLWPELWAYYVDMAAGVITPRETLASGMSVLPTTWPLSGNPAGRIRNPGADLI